MPGLPSHIHHNLLTLYHFTLTFILSIALTLFTYSCITLLSIGYKFRESPDFALSPLSSSSVTSWTILKKYCLRAQTKLYLYIFFQLECKLLANKDLVSLTNSCVPGAQHCSWLHENLSMTVLNDQKHGTDGAS